MFIELVRPKPLDILCTRDRIKLRIMEPESSGRFWVNLTFHNDSELTKFIDDLTAISKRPREFNP
jgi:hypothetical protein